MTGQRISSHHLRVWNLDAVHDFYVDGLGMDVVRSEPELLSLTLGSACTELTFRVLDVIPFQASGNDFYWKIGITVRDLDAAVKHLGANGVEASAPQQFRDIGYLSHVADPNGFPVELLQQGFEGNELPLSEGHPIGRQAEFAHITLRVTDLDAATRYFGGTLGMRLMSVQPVSDRGFCLYFYGWSDEELPDADITSVSNREWLWRRPYTLIELQHLTTDGATVHKAPETGAGFDGFGIIDESGSETFISTQELEGLS